VSQGNQSAPSSFEGPIRLQALRQIQNEARDQVRTEAWAAMRAQFRGALVGLGVVSLAVGALIGYYGGGRQAGRRQGNAPAAVWDCPRAGIDTREEGISVQPTPWPIRIYVSGAVAEPRVVALPPGSLVSDALDAVGGASTDADLAALNLAASLRDHQHVQVPRLSQRLAPAATAPAAEGADEAIPASGSLIDINTASMGELEALPGIGPTRARDIIAFREANGPFATIADIVKVPGIGRATYDRLVLLITVGEQLPVQPDTASFP
jgi:comEA protein